MNDSEQSQAPKSSQKKGIAPVWLIAITVVFVFALSISSSNAKFQYNIGYADGYTKALEEAGYDADTITAAISGETTITPFPAQTPEVTATHAFTPTPTPTPTPTNTPTPTQKPTATPTPRPTATPVPQAPISYTVYITRTGEKYHSYGCQYLRQSCIAIDKDDAIAQGYSPCSKCNP